MRPQERLGDPFEAMRMMLDGRQAAIWTALPCLLVSFDSVKMTAVLQPAIQMQIRSPLGDWQNATLPLLYDCPVQFPGGGGYSATFPLAENDEMVAIFSSRCIDSWWQSGGIQPQFEFRMHDLSDAFCFPRVWSQPNKPGAAASATTAQLRKDDGTTYVELDGTAVNIVAPGGVNITTPTMTVNGAIVATEEITTEVSGGITFSTHVHTEVMTGNDNTGGPVG